MPLMDHFYPPLSTRRQWHASHHAWATHLSSQLNERLPEGYFAEPNVQFGIEDEIEVLVYGIEGGPVLAAAIDLVSPANKDRPGHRRAFVSKCETYLQQHAGLMIVDVVSSRTANLHDELMEQLGQSSAPLENPIYASAYRTVRRDGRSELDVWESALGIGKPLPSMPLFLAGSNSVMVDFEAAYQRTCRELRLSLN